MASTNLETIAQELAKERPRRAALGAALAVATTARRSEAGKKRCVVRHSEEEIRRFIKRAARKYGQKKKVMLRVAQCESNLNPCAYNRSGPYYGLFQFLKSTWKTTPYGKRDIYSPKAQALATAWMWKQGRKNEWACK
jgi:hypothetical protein